MKFFLRLIRPACLIAIGGVLASPMTVAAQSFSGKVVTDRNSAWIGVGGEGSFRIFGGFEWGDSGSGLSIGMSGGSGYVEISSGSITAAVIHVSGASSTGTFNLRGGETRAGALSIHGGGTMLVEPGAFFSANYLQMQDAAGEPPATLIHKGLLEVRYFWRSGYGNSSRVEIDGGTIRFNSPTSNIYGFLPGDVTLVNAGGIFDTQGFSVPIDVTLGGAGALTKTGSGTLSLNTSQSYTGATHVNEGTLKVRNGTFASASVALAEGTTFEAENVPSYSGAITGEGRFVKLGPDTTTLSGESTYTGTTTITEGRLVVNGSIASSALTTVGNGGTLSGSGTVGALVVEGTLSPGNSPGTLNAGDTDWLSGATYVWEINDATGEAGTNWDLLSVDGTLSLTGLDAGNPFTIALHSLGLDDEPGLTANFNPTQSYTWILVTTTAGISGFDESTFVVDASGFANAPHSSRFSLSSDGTTLTLTYSAVPEPATWGAMIGIGLLAMAALRRRRA